MVHDNGSDAGGASAMNRLNSAARNSMFFTTYAPGSSLADQRSLGPMKPFTRFLAALLIFPLAALAVSAQSGTAATPRHPNVIIIFTDDQGYGDVGVYGAKGFTTPHLDRLASEGTRFTNFHVAQAVCSASRAALLTGCYPERVGISGALGPQS